MVWLDPDRQLEGGLAFAAEFEWRDFRSAWILLLLLCGTSLVLASLEDGSSRDRVPSGCLERHLTALPTKPQWKLTGLWGIRLFIFSNKKLVFRRWSSMNCCIFVVSNAAASLLTADVSGLLPSETWRAEIVYTLSADLHLCLCSQSTLKKTNGSMWVTGYCTDLASLRFECESFFCALISCSAAFSLLWYPTSLPSSFCVFSQREMPPVPAPDPCGPLPPSQLGVGIARAGSWSSLGSSHVSF